MPLFILMTLISLAFTAVMVGLSLAVRLGRLVVRIILGPLATKLTQVHERNLEALSKGSLQEVLSRRSAQMLGKDMECAGDFHDSDGSHDDISSPELTMSEDRHQARRGGFWER